jgi:hypothetical protein
MKSPVALALQLLGAVAGLGAITTFVGGAMLWIRFSELNLPSDQAVTLLPKQLLLIVGAHSMAAPVVLGLLAALLFALFNAFDPERRRRWLRPVFLGLLLIGGGLAAAVAVEPYELVPEWVVTALACVLGAAALIAVLAVADNSWALPWAVFIVFVLCGAVVSVMRTTGNPTMEPVAVLLEGTPSGIGGFFVGQTSDRLYLAPLPGSGDPGDPFADADIDRIMAVDRDKVVQLALREPTPTHDEAEGRDQAQTLLEDLRVLVAGAPSPVPEKIVTRDPVTAFAPLVHLHSREDLWPMSAEDFLKHSWLAWAHDGCDDWVPAGNHLRQPKIDAAAKGAFDRRRLAGANAYAHRAADADCRETGPSFTAAQHTRPADDNRRVPGLDPREGFYLDLDDSKRKGTRYVRQEGPQLVFERVPVYFECAGCDAPDQRELRITYWLFYALSRPAGKTAVTKHLVHEGDWERISVLLHRGKNDGEYLPISVRYHTHDQNRDVPWRAVKRVGTAGADASTHPVAFSARGSHATYWRSGDYENVLKAGSGRRLLTVFDDAFSCPGCPQWRTWERLLDARTQPWYGFGGAWGAVTSRGGFNGPLGPSPHKSGDARSPVQSVRQAEAPVTGPPPDLE